MLKLKEFSSLIFSNLVVKAVNSIRELVIVYLIGIQTEFSSYLKVLSLTDIITLFIGMNVLEAIFIPIFSGYEENKYNYKIQLYSIMKVSAFITVLIIASIAGYYYFFQKEDLLNLLPIIIIISITIGLMLVYHFGSTILIAEDNIKEYAKISVYNSVISILLIYPFILLFGVTGIALNRLLVVAICTVITWYSLNKDKKESFLKKMSMLDIIFNKRYLILANIYNVLIIAVGRLIIGHKDESFIIHYYYVVLILNVFLNIVVQSINTVFLQKISKGIDMKKLMDQTIMFYIIVCISMFIFSGAFLKLIFMWKLSDKDIEIIVYCFRLLIWGYLFNFVSSVLLQPLIANVENKNSINALKKIVISYFISLALILIIDISFNFNAIELSGIYIICSTFFVFLISFYYNLKYQ